MTLVLVSHMRAVKARSELSVCDQSEDAYYNHEDRTTLCVRDKRAYDIFLSHDTGFTYAILKIGNDAIHQNHITQLAKYCNSCDWNITTSLLKHNFLGCTFNIVNLLDNPYSHLRFDNMLLFSASQAFLIWTTLHVFPFPTSTHR